MKNDGPLITLAYGLHSLLRALGLGSCQFYGFFVQQLSDGAMPRCYHSQLIEIPQQFGEELGLAKDVIRQRLGDGAQCVGTFYQNNSSDEAPLVGAVWYAKPPFLEDEVAAVYRHEGQQSWCWDFGVYVHPEWRSSRAFAASWMGVTAHMRHAGFIASLSRISLYNKSSVLAHQRLGAALVGRALFVRLGSLQITLSNRKPWLKLTWRGKNPPIFSFDLAKL